MYVRVHTLLCCGVFFSICYMWNPQKSSLHFTDKKPEDDREILFAFYSKRNGSTGDAVVDAGFHCCCSTSGRQ